MKIFIFQVSGFAFAGYTAGIVTYLVTKNLHLSLDSLPTAIAQVFLPSGV